MGPLFFSLGHKLKGETWSVTYKSTSGHLTGCGGADPHNSSTSACSTSLGHFMHKARKLLHISEKATAYHPHKLNSEDIDHFEEVIHPKQRPKHAFSFVNNFKPLGVSCIFW